MPVSYDVKDIVFCREEDVADDLREFFVKKGYAVGVSTVEIETGTHGLHCVKKLDVLQSGVLESTASEDTISLKKKVQNGERLSDASIRYLIEQAEKADRYEKGLKEIGEMYEDTGKTVLDATGMLVLSRYVLDLRNEY